MAQKKRRKGRRGEDGLRSDILLLLLLAVSVLLLLGNFGLAGTAGRWLSFFFFGLFGSLEYIFPVLLFLSGAFLAANRKNHLAVRKTAGGAGVFFFACAFFHLLTMGYSPVSDIRSLFLDSVGDRLGGGIIGGGLVQLTGRAFGTAGAYVVILAALAIFAIIMTQTPLLSRAREKGEKVHTAAREYRTQAFRQREDRRQKRKLAAEAREKQMKKH